jgi:hypothetical protein
MGTTPFQNRRHSCAALLDFNQHAFDGFYSRIHRRNAPHQTTVPVQQIGHARWDQRDGPEVRNMNLEVVWAETHNYKTKKIRSHATDCYIACHEPHTHYKKKKTKTSNQLTSNIRQVTSRG